MKPHQYIIRCLFLVAVCVTLAGCETVEQSVADMRDKWSNINFPTVKQQQPADDKPLSSEAVLAAEENCPYVSVVNELSELHQFAGTDSTESRYNISNVRISEIVSSCHYNEYNVIVEMDIRFEGQIGPQGRVMRSDEVRFAYPYFVAIASEQGNILAKEVFAATLSYPEGEDENVHEEHVRQIIPLAGRIGGTAPSVLIGFQLTEQQLAYNRSRKVLKTTEMEQTGEQEVAEEIVFDRQPGKPFDITEPIDITATLEN